MRRPFAACLICATLGLGLQASCSLERPRENAALPTVPGPNAGGRVSQPDAGGAAGMVGSGAAPGSAGAAGAPGSGGGGAPSGACAGLLPGELSFTKTNLLRSVAACAELRHCEFDAAAKELASLASAYQASPNAEALGAVRSALGFATERAARIEVMRFGPAASAQDDMEHGQGLRDLIYSWPNVSRCRVEEQVIGQAYAEVGFDNLVQVPINSRGLFAIEYLSSYSGTDNVCSPFSIANAGDAWNQLSADELAAIKRKYLAAVAGDVSQRASDLFATWSVGGYDSELLAGEGYMGIQGALNAVAQGFVYLDVELKDYKLGAPAGLYDMAPVERAELSFSEGATGLLQQNLLGFRDVYQGCGPTGDGLGYDDWLQAVGHSGLADELRVALEDVIAAVGAFPPLSTATEAELRELHAALKRLTDPLKTEFFGAGSPLGLSLPAAVEGDTD